MNLTISKLSKLLMSISKSKLSNLDDIEKIVMEIQKLIDITIIAKKVWGFYTLQENYQKKDFSIEKISIHSRKSIRKRCWINSSRPKPRFLFYIPKIEESVPIISEFDNNKYIIVACFKKFIYRIKTGTSTIEMKANQIIKLKGLYTHFSNNFRFLHSMLCEDWRQFLKNMKTSNHFIPLTSSVKKCEANGIDLVDYPSAKSKKNRGVPPNAKIVHHNLERNKIIEGFMVLFGEGFFKTHPDPEISAAAKNNEYARIFDLLYMKTIAPKRIKSYSIIASKISSEKLHGFAGPKYNAINPNPYMKEGKIDYEKFKFAFLDANRNYWNAEFGGSKKCIKNIEKAIQHGELKWEVFMADEELIQISKVLGNPERKAKILERILIENFHIMVELDELMRIFFGSFNKYLLSPSGDLRKWKIIEDYSNSSIEASKNWFVVIWNRLITQLKETLFPFFALSNNRVLFDEPNNWFSSSKRKWVDLIEESYIKLIENDLFNKHRFEWSLQKHFNIDTDEISFRDFLKWQKGDKKWDVTKFLK
jgi:hypothetical protein